MKEDWDIEIRRKTSLLDIDLKELWRYRDLLMMYVRRDIVTFYNRTELVPICIKLIVYYSK